MSDFGGDGGDGGGFDGGHDSGGHHAGDHSSSHHTGHHGHHDTFAGYIGGYSGYDGGGDDSSHSGHKGAGKPVPKVSAEEAVKANFSDKVSVLSKIVRSVISFGGLIVTVDGVKRMCSLKRTDDKGKESNPFVAGAVEAGVGAAITYQALVHGGAEKIAASRK